MATDKDKIYGEHMLAAIRGIENFTAGLAYEQFADDLKTALAVTRELEIIGEASKRLSEEFKKKRAQIPWRKIGGMRDFLIHDYAEVDFMEVWKAATEDIAELKKVLENDQ